MIEEIRIEKELCNALQARSIELSGLEKLIAFVMSNESGYTIPKEKEDALLAEHARVNGEYEILKGKVNKILFEDYNVKSTTPWTLDFESGIITLD